MRLSRTTMWCLLIVCPVHTRCSSGRWCFTSRFLQHNTQMNTGCPLQLLQHQFLCNLDPTPLCWDRGCTYSPSRTVVTNTDPFHLGCKAGLFKKNEEIRTIQKKKKRKFKVLKKKKIKCFNWEGLCFLKGGCFFKITKEYSAPGSTQRPQQKSREEVTAPPKRYHSSSALCWAPAQNKVDHKAWSL